ncbi:uncharacterized protein FIBRA_04280 [Fibroporia radiculosa]|uniref:Uncharacterized protein n=1 Tax=Fibroporia radiculosa TaxID=599839 RepID=J4GP08_9APHY|nr:uncharacterized protein FIBRA_04280 [Fibroporia radiculosa]CCM02200.1 predicted protein [Fibroporia radiculosa]
MWPWSGSSDVDAPWEVVDAKSVDPVKMYDDEDSLDIIRISHTSLKASYVFNVKTQYVHEDDTSGHKVDLQAALRFTRARVLQEASRLGYNTLLLEGWSITLLRKPSRSTHHTLFRMALRYIARPAFVHTPGERLPPPFLDLLQYWGEETEKAYLTGEEATGVVLLVRSTTKRSSEDKEKLVLDQGDVRQVGSSWHWGSCIKLRLRRYKV